MPCSSNGKMTFTLTVYTLKRFKCFNRIQIKQTAKAVGVDLNLKLTNLMAGDHLKPEFIEVNLHFKHILLLF